MNKKLLSAILCVVLVLAQISVLAASFKDVNATKYSWATDAINEMSQLGIINGYDELTFGPEDPVKRVDALLLVSRIAGSVTEGEKDYLKKAYDTYSESVSALGFDAYEETLSYLLYRNIYTENELSNFLKNNLGKSELKRYEAAIILVKLIGAESVVKQNTMPVLSFDDSASIPANAKAYVEYCYENELMKGMSETEFSPNTSVTRAQMAVLLKKAMDKLDLTFSRGTIAEINTVTKSITYTENNGNEKTVYLTGDIPVKLNGRDVGNLESLGVDDQITCIYSSKEPIFIEALKVIPDSTVTGVLSGKTINNSGNSISVKDDITSTQAQEYFLSSDCRIVIDGSVANIDRLTSGMRLSLTIKDGEVTKITATNVVKTVKGTIEEIIISATPSIKIKTDSSSVSYPLDTSDVKISVNGNNQADIYDLRLGDNAVLTIEKSTVVKLEIESGAFTVDTVNIIGTIANVDQNYMCITLNMTDDTTQQIFVKKNASIIDGKTQNTRTLDSLKAGETITAVITSNGFTSEAISIVVLAAE